MIVTARSRLIAIVMAVGAIGACAASQEPTPCTAPLVATASAGREPVFTWTPACGIAEIAVNDDVAPGDTGQTRWWAQTRDGRNTISSGVRFGSMPSGTRLVVAPTALLAGHSYLVTLLWYTDLDNGMKEAHAARTRFMP